LIVFIAGDHRVTASKEVKKVVHQSYHRQGAAFVQVIG
jgi:hypothetical protein